MKIMDTSDDGGGCLHRLSFGNQAEEEFGLHTTSTRQCAPDARLLQNIHQTLKPGLRNEFNLHGMHTKIDKEIDAHGEKTPTKDVIYHHSHQKDLLPFQNKSLLKAAFY